MASFSQRSSDMAMIRLQDKELLTPLRICIELLSPLFELHDCWVELGDCVLCTMPSLISSLPLATA